MMIRKSFWLLVLSIGLASCESGSGLLAEQEYAEKINADNNPNAILSYGEYLNGFLAQLPTSGGISRYWYSPGYFPFTSEGTAARPAGESLSPIEKYDLAFNSGMPATQWEKKYHGTDGGQASPQGWEGHCNGVAAAIAVAPEPKRTVSFNNQTFTPYDIKALLAESLYHCESGFVGLRCDSNSNSTDSYGRPINDACRDMNAGSLHVLLANMIGSKGEMVVMDMSRGFMVWNYPIAAFRVLENRSIDGREANLLVSSNALGSNIYAFNPEAKRFASVKTEVTYIGSSANQMTFEYVLELNDGGKIMGGEWTGSSKESHPDFLWKVEEPKSANPYVDFYQVRKLVKMAM